MTRVTSIVVTSIVVTSIVVTSIVVTSIVVTSIEVTSGVENSDSDDELKSSRGTSEVDEALSNVHCNIQCHSCCYC